ncbi:endonuclease MutS2, partial [bacterium LRH843]|nr:endonuclease MutS2 [bacterium LRH843]
EAETLRKESEKLHQELQRQIIEFNEQRDKLYEKAEKKAEDTIKEASQEAENIIRNLRQMQKNQQASIKEHELIEARKRLEDAVPTLEKSKKQ